MNITMLLSISSAVAPLIVFPRDQLAPLRFVRASGHSLTPLVQPWPHVTGGLLRSGDARSQCGDIQVDCVAEVHLRFGEIANLYHGFAGHDSSELFVGPPDSHRVPHQTPDGEFALNGLKDDHTLLVLNS